MSRIHIGASALAVICLVFLCSRTATAATPGVSTPFSGPVGFMPWSVGWRFQALQDVDVVSLGAWDYPGDGDGLPSSVNVGLWTDSGTPLGSLTVPAGMAGTLVDGYRYADLTTSISLSTGEFYRIAASPTSGNLPYMFSTSVTESPAVDYDTGYLVQNSNSLVFPTSLGGNAAYFGPNLLYLLPVFDPADTDKDGDVDTADLTTMFQNFTGDGGMGKTMMQGDTDMDGDVDTADITTGLQNFTGAQAGLVSVPEPNTWVLLVVGGALLLCVGRWASFQGSR